MKNIFVILILVISSHSLFAYIPEKDTESPDRISITLFPASSIGAMVFGGTETTDYYHLSLAMSIEGELRLTNHFSFAGDFRMINTQGAHYYDFFIGREEDDHSRTWEHTNLLMCGPGIRYYFFGTGIKGPFVGIYTDYYRIEHKRKDYNSDTDKLDPAYTRRHYRGIIASAWGGYRFYRRRHFFMEVSGGIMYGYFKCRSSDTDGNMKKWTSRKFAPAGFGLGIGFAF